MLTKNLFSPKKIGNLEMENRVIFPAMCTVFADNGGFVSDKLIDYHVARAKGGCGLNIVEIASVHPTSSAPKVLGLYDDKYLPGLTKLAESIKAVGGKACIQLWHAGRQTNSIETGMPILAPSPIPCPLCQEIPEELTLTQIKELIEAYGDAALRAKHAGFDAIELHGAHGYLINQFLSPYSNQRADHYGGSLENRIRFALEVIENIKSKTDNDFPIIFRMSSEEKVANGLTLDESKSIAQILERAGVHALHVSIGVYETVYYTIPTIDIPLAFNVAAAAEIKSVVGIPVITVGRINDPLLAEKILDEEKADFVAIGRGQISDPEFCNKSMQDDFDSIVKCVGCIQGCFDIVFGSGLSEPASCLLNPSVGYEKQYEIQVTNERKNIMVVGGGPGGLQAALMFHQQGHSVTLFERTSTLGGQLSIAGVAPRKSEFYQAAQRMGERAIKSGIDIKLQTEVTTETIAHFKPDVVILASGSSPIVPKIDGIHKPHVTTAHDVLEGKTTVMDHVIVVGGGLVGLEVSEFLAKQGKKVTVVEMQAEVAKDMGFIRKVLTLQHIQTAGIEIITHAKCLEIRDNSILIERDGIYEELNDVHSVVLAVGSKSNDSLVSYLKDSGFNYYVVGDAKGPRKALDAIREASEVVLKLV